MDTFFKTKSKSVKSYFPKTSNRASKVKSLFELGGLISKKKVRPKKRILKESSESISSFGPILDKVHQDRLGEDIYDSRVSCSVVKNSSEEDEIFSAGTILCDSNISDSYMLHCNHRFHENWDSNIGEKLWLVIANLGVVLVGEEKNMVKRIKSMESTDKERKKVVKEYTNLGR